MLQQNSPLEHLAAFTIVLVVGIGITIGFGQYIAKIKRDAQYKSPES